MAKAKILAETIMDKKITKAKGFWRDKLPRWARIITRGILGLVLLIVIAYIGLAWYINTNKKEVLASVTTTLNEGISGSLTIGGMETTFLRGFPNVSLELNNVVLRDSLYTTHKRTLLTAGQVEVSINTLALLRGAIEIKKVAINNAFIDLFTTAQGYSNTSVFKKKNKSDKQEGGGGSFPELRKVALNNVSFRADNKKSNKLYNFMLQRLMATVNYKSSGWEAGVELEAMAKSMAFNTGRGSFIKDKQLDGRFDITYDEDNGTLKFKKNKLIIGRERFTVEANLGVGEGSSEFIIKIANDEILWGNAARLLSPNITKKLMMFDLKEPIAVTCDLVGDFNSNGDPLIFVTAKVKDNVLATPGGDVAQCNFTGIFTNNNIKERGFNDANSAIKLFKFEGNYAGLPFVMKRAAITDLEKPIATGDFTSDFEMKKLAGLVDDDLLKFTKGTGNVKVNFRADIVNYQLAKPFVNGIIKINDASITYVPRKLDFKDVSVNLDFTKDDLHISEIVLKSGKSIVNMEGTIKNFLNLYYTDPKKIVLQWEINSPQLHLGEFMGFLGTRKNTQAAIKKNRKGNFTEDLNLLFEKSNVDMKLRVSKLYYNNFYASNAKADVLLTDTGVIVKNAGLNHAGGTLLINGSMLQGKVNNYKLDAKVNNVDVQKFFYAFDNFGMETLTSSNLKGYFSSVANVTGSLTDSGTLVPRSINGTVNFDLKKGRLVNFEPVRNVGKFAFPFRDMKNIEFANLKGRLNVKGEKVTIYPMQINSSVLNMDIEGVYSFGKGTQIYVDVPLRNPKKDEDITDKKELAKRRNRGIVVHLTAEDDADGKVKVKLGKKDD